MRKRFNSSEGTLTNPLPESNLAFSSEEKFPEILLKSTLFCDFKFFPSDLLTKLPIMHHFICYKGIYIFQIIKRIRLKIDGLKGIINLWNIDQFWTILTSSFSLTRIFLVAQTARITRIGKSLCPCWIPGCGEFWIASGVLALTDNLVSPTDLHGFTRIFARAALVLAVRMGKHERSEIWIFVRSVRLVVW